ncbi:MAG: HDOD domain-containing protein [Deltaproteobacteria bacterium]|jgi:putative nucleotidyltransferase with HDIG domain|nr:HDOD domain-containing protein [Deltaproteobacteria bacterium]
MENAKLEKILSKVDSFPSMPAAGSKLLCLLEEQDVSISEVEDILRYDPGLTANVLKLANSAYFGIPSRIGSVKQAIILLGTNRLIQLVTASCVGAVMKKAVPGYNIPAGNLWRHSIAVSIAAEALVKDKKNLNSEDFFTPALLHDVGKLVLGNFVKEDLNAIESITDKGIPFVVAENMILGADHTEIGARILSHWSFPDDVVNAVRYHHDPESAETSSMKIDVVHLSNLLCQMNSTAPNGAGQAVELSPAVIDRLGIDLSQFEGISEKVSDWVEEVSSVLTLNE